jgi:hypothetical protein
MAILLDQFLQFHRDKTKQIGKKFCIPASMCNALRLCDVVGCTQEQVRDEWYAENQKQKEPKLDDQMDGADFRIFETLERRTKYVEDIDNEYFSQPKDSDPFNLQKADLALDFIERHINAEHPVIVSTWNRVQVGDVIEIKGYHMWLILDFDRTGNVATFHDSLDDEIKDAKITSLKPVKLKGKEYQLDMGLRGCITHSDYSCLALWRK